MAIRSLRRGAVVALVTALAGTTAGCAGSPLGEILGGVLSPQGTSGNEVGAEVRSVDTRSQQLHLRLQNGQSATVLFDNRTQVVYQQQQYPVTALEAGDYVVVRLQQTQNGQAYTDYIYVQQSVQDRTGGGGVGGAGYQRLEGNVGAVDYSRGLFELRSQGRTVTVSLPYNPGAAAADQFRRLRQGDYVRVEGRYVTNTRFELDRFY